MYKKIKIFITLSAFTSIIMFALSALPNLTNIPSNNLTIANAMSLTPTNAPPNIAFTKINTTELPIPPLLPGEMINGVRVYNLTMISSTTEFTPGIETATRGYNGSYLGPTMIMTYGEVISANFTNNLGVKTTNHWHGLHVPAIMDGGPHQGIEPGTTWRPTFTFLNKAALLWYHPHPHGEGSDDPDATGGQVYSGLAGLIIAKDDESAQIDLPRTYGVDEIPLVIQDRDFDSTGQFTYTGFFRKGSTFLVNGAIAPTLNTHAQVIRFRILNASNTRIFNFGFSDNRSYTVIGSDGGLLPAPTTVTRTLLSPAERADILVEFTGEEDSSLTFMAYNSEIVDIYVPSFSADAYDTSNYDIFGINIGAQSSNPVTTIPTTLPSFTRLDENEASNLDSPRTFVLENGVEINGTVLNMDIINEYINVNTVEIWELSNTTAFAHPLHIHDDQFQILTRNGEAPDASELGWKDTVLISPDETVRIIKPFEDFADSTLPYMYHCHLLEHEDSGMMGQFATEISNFFSTDESNTGIAGQTIHYTHVLTNFAGNISDTFTLDVSSSQGWDVSTTPASPITLGPAETQIITVSVTITPDATTGEIDDTSTTVTSYNNPNISDIVVDATTVTGTVAPSEITIFDGTTAVPDNTGSIDFGETSVGLPITKTLIVFNTGEVSLVITDLLNIPPGFVSVDFTSTTVLSNSTTTFSIQLTANEPGIFSGEFSFSNSDEDENPYNFTISGIVRDGTLSLPSELHVLDGNTHIPDETGFVDFGIAILGAPITKTFTISNIGETPLIITGPLNLPPGFGSVNFTNTTVAPNSSSTFNVQLLANVPGPVQGTLAFANSDSNENPYNFTITGDVRNPADDIDLPIPSLLTGTMIDGIRVYSLTIDNTTTEFISGFNTETKGYNNNYLAPTLVMTQGEVIAAHITNNLDRNSSFYWHGLHVPSLMDGGPHQLIAPNTTWEPTFTFLNRASLYWYHPLINDDGGARNPDGTSGQVYRGLAGLIISKDSESSQLALPDTYGIDEIPLIIQDRAFGQNGQLLEPQGPGPFFRKGGSFLVNGAIDPTLHTYAQVIRFRILNASNARIYNFGLQNDHPFYQIGSDGGLLEAPIELTRLTLAPGERADILVDFSADLNRRIHFRAYNSELTNILPPQDGDPFDRTDFDIFGINVGQPIAEAITEIPASLTPITRLDPNDAVNTNNPRRFDLENGAQINNVQMDLDDINEIVNLNTIEVWEVTNRSRFAQPFHIDDGAFQILSRNDTPPHPSEMGWKDTVLIKPTERIRLIRTFEDFADPVLGYVYYSQLLEEKDNGMMGQFSVLTDNFIGVDSTGSGAPGTIINYTHTLTNFSANVTDTFTLNTFSTQRWSVSTTPPSPVTVGPGKTKTIIVSVFVDNKAPLGTMDITRITARSGNNPNIFERVIDTSTVISGPTGFSVYLPMIIK